MKLLKEGYSYLFNSKEEGRFVNLPYNILESRDRSELHEKIRILLQEFDCPYILKSDSEAEDLLSGISESLPDSEWLDMPCDGEYTYFIEFSDNLVVFIDAQDTYIGMGEYQIYACINGIIFKDEIKNEEVINFVEWMKTLR